MWGVYSSDEGEEEGGADDDEDDNEGGVTLSSSSGGLSSSASKTALVSQDAFDALRSASLTQIQSQSHPENEELPPPPPVKGPKPLLLVSCGTMIVVQPSVAKF